ncbi:MAG: ion channel [Bdellovibrionota bacterium]
MTRKRRHHHTLASIRLVVRKRLHALFKQPIFRFITIWGHACILSGTFGFYYFEHGINPKIHNLLDTLVWTIGTVTTVGNGDVAAVTTGGKFTSIAMMILGSLFLWSYTALFAGALVAPELRQVEEEVEEIERDIKIDEQSIDELVSQIALLTHELKKRTRQP